MITKSRIIGPINLPDITLLFPVSCKMQLNNEQKCVKRARTVNESNSSASVYRRITKFCMDIHTDRVYSFTGYDTISYSLSVGIYVSWQQTWPTDRRQTVKKLENIFQFNQYKFEAQWNINYLHNLSVVCSYFTLWNERKCKASVKCFISEPTEDEILRMVSRKGPARQISTLFKAKH